MKKYLRYGLFGLFFYLIFLLVSLPASFLLNFSDGRIGPALPFGVEGSIWSGKASLLRVNNLDFEQFRWDTNLSGLLTGALDMGIYLKYGRGHLQGDLGVQLIGKDRIYFDDLKSMLYVQEIVDVIQPNSPVKFTGKLSSNLDTFSFLPKAKVIEKADGTITWKDAVARIGPEELPLGNFTLTLTTNNGVVEAKFKDDGKKNPIEANLVATMAQNGDITINGKIGHRPNAHKVLINLLKVPFAGKSEKIFNVEGNINQIDKLSQELMKK